MMIISSNRNYYYYIFCISLIALGVLILLFLFKKSNFYLYLILFLTFELILLSIKFTQFLKIDVKGINIIYYRFLLKKQVYFKINEIEVELDYSGSFRSPKHAVLKILTKNKVAYKIDSRDGFTEQDLTRIKDFFP